LFKLWWSICWNVLKRLRRRRLMEPPDGTMICMAHVIDVSIGG